MNVGHFLRGTAEPMTREQEDALVQILIKQVDPNAATGYLIRLDTDYPTISPHPLAEKGKVMIVGSAMAFMGGISNPAR